jgi:hypothetical protein
MPQTYKQLFASAPAATTLTVMYTVAAATSSIISTIAVCNRGATPTAVRLAHAPAGAADAVTHYFLYDAQLPANTTTFLTGGITLAATDVLRGYVSAATITVIGWGEERT